MRLPTWKFRNDEQEREESARRLHEAAWPDMFANLQSAYAELTNAQFELERRTAEISETRDLFRRPLTAKELAKFEAVVLDPPRAGAREQVAEIAASPVPRLAYVSCNPATFARDASILANGGYRLDWVQPVGQFRWSTHVELAAAFSRN